MPVTVERIPGEPIIMAKLSGDLTVDDVVEMFTRSAEIIKDVEGTVYRITNVQDIKAPFVEAMKTVQAATKGRSGSTSDPRIYAMFVGNTQWVDFYRNALQQEQFGGISLPVFASKEEALEHIRQHRAGQLSK
jgi:hypothetical protein